MGPNALPAVMILVPGVPGEVDPGPAARSLGVGSTERDSCGRPSPDGAGSAAPPSGEPQAATSTRASRWSLMAPSLRALQPGGDDEVVTAVRAPRVGAPAREGSMARWSVGSVGDEAG